jgi:S-methylmethionine-dependent homocysteine/selenocysteine methylase
MAKYRDDLPQQTGELFLTDGGLETTLIFHNGLDLPEFAAFDLLRTKEGYDKLTEYYRRYAAIARDNGTGFIFEGPTWRANKDWGLKIGYSSEALEDMNIQAIRLLEIVRDEYENGRGKMVISGNLGPRDDGYNPVSMMTTEEAEQYHAAQINTFRDSNADMVTALTMTYAEEAIGITKAAQAAGLPVVISFTVEIDGRLPNGQTLGAAITEVDQVTDNGPEYYMINCAHPTHFEHALQAGEPWVNRIHGIRANASCMSHAELDEATELDDGNPLELGDQHRELSYKLRNLNVLGGCCGTDHRHVEAICKAFVPQYAS